MADQTDLRARPRDADEEALPLPSGTSLYESLTAKFIAFDRLLNTLAETRYSGYIRLLASGSNGVILLRDGSVVDSLHRQDATLLVGDQAMSTIERLVESGQGVVDVVTLDGGLIDGLHHLASGVPAYPDMRASWINAPGLVEFLKSRRFTGALSVRAEGGAGVIMFDEGTVTGAFTTESRTMGSDAATVLGLCQDSEAQIEVHAAAGRPGASAFEEPAGVEAPYAEAPPEDLQPESAEQPQGPEHEREHDANRVSRFFF
jgi:hypothetical protein